METITISNKMTASAKAVALKRKAAVIIPRALTRQLNEVEHTEIERFVKYFEFSDMHKKQRFEQLGKYPIQHYQLEIADKAKHEIEVKIDMTGVYVYSVRILNSNSLDVKEYVVTRTGFGL